MKDSEAWRAAVHGVTNSQTQQMNNNKTLMPTIYYQSRSERLYLSVKERTDCK